MKDQEYVVEVRRTRVAAGVPDIPWSVFWRLCLLAVPLGLAVGLCATLLILLIAAVGAMP